MATHMALSSPRVGEQEAGDYQLYMRRSKEVEQGLLSEREGGEREGGECEGPACKGRECEG